MAYLCKQYRNGSPRTGKPSGSKAARRRSTKKSYDSLTASFQTSGGYPKAPKRDATAVKRFQIPEHVKLEWLLAKDRDGDRLAGPHVAAFFHDLVRENPKLAEAILAANERRMARAA